MFNESGNVVIGDLEDLKRRLVVGHKSDGRSVYDAVAKSELVALRRQPGASWSRLARECGVNADQVRRWLREHAYGGRRRKAASVLPASAAFLPVAVQPAVVDTRRDDDAGAVMAVHARLPNGVAYELCRKALVEAQALVRQGPEFDGQAEELLLQAGGELARALGSFDRLQRRFRAANDANSSD